MFNHWSLILTSFFNSTKALLRGLLRDQWYGLHGPLISRFMSWGQTWHWGRFPWDLANRQQNPRFPRDRCNREQKRWDDEVAKRGCKQEMKNRMLLFLTRWWRKGCSFWRENWSIPIFAKPYLLICLLRCLEKVQKISSQIMVQSLTNHLKQIDWTDGQVVGPNSLC